MVGLTVLWFFTDPVFVKDYDFFVLRNAIMNYTGVIGIGVMSVAMILAIRPTIFETWFGGLDKFYRLHKWLGITGLCFSVVHYLWANVPKWMVGFGLLARPERHKPVEESLAILRFFQQQRELAESIGEWAFYGVFTLMILALVKYFPYKYFFKTHRLIAIAYVLLVTHSVMLMDFSYWNEFIGPVMAILLIGGIIGAIFSLTRTIGFRHRYQGEIHNLESFQNNTVLKVTLSIEGDWTGHKPGQFAFLTFDHNEGPHPFTISSSWQNNGKLVFMIKGLGDYTKKLPKILKIGDRVTVEGPYGVFNFNGTKLQQIWVAGGIGITPFISRMEDLVNSKQYQEIDLFYSTGVVDDLFLESVVKMAERAKINLHLVTPSSNQLVDTDLITKIVQDWKQADIWFCGPAGYGKVIKNGFSQLGMAKKQFHQELFDMR
jgi:predicted ferric reductase